jgi:peptide/nickel transport system permease protein
MGRMFTRRLIQMALLFLIFLTLVFFLLQLQPGNAATQLSQNPDVPPEARRLMAARLGIDQPVHIQYFRFMGNYLTGDMGFSFSRYPQAVWDVIWIRIPRTVVLIGAATLLAYAMGFSLGKVLAWKRGRFIETGTTVVGVALFTVFYPWYALMSLWFFGSVLGWVPLGRFTTLEVWRGSPFQVNQVFMRMATVTAAAVAAMFLIRWAAKRLTDSHRARRAVSLSGYLVVLVVFGWYWWSSPMRVYAADIAHHTILPVFVLSSIIFGGVMLLMRSSMLETLREDYVLTARAKGLSQRRIRDGHAARNALLPVTTSFVLALAGVVGGAIVTETVFSWPGVGQLFVESIDRNDTPLTIGVLVWVGVLALIAHLVADILYMYLDPRIRKGV